MTAPPVLPLHRPLAARGHLTFRRYEARSIRIVDRRPIEARATPDLVTAAVAVLDSVQAKDLAGGVATVSAGALGELGSALAGTLDPRKSAA